MRRTLSALVLLAALVAAPAAHAWTWPAAGPVLRPFSVGPDSYAPGQHRGVDIGAELGSPVMASAAGTVSFVGSVPRGGRAVTIQTPDGYAVTLLQLGSTSVVRGSVVAEGAVVGAVGESADPGTSAPHVHLGVRVAADPDGYVDPLGLLPARSVVAVPVPAPASAPAAEPTPTAAPAAPTPAAPTPTVAPTPTPSLAEAPPLQAEPPPVPTPLPAVPVAEAAVAEAPTRSALQKQPSASWSYATRERPASHPSARSVVVKPTSMRLRPTAVEVSPPADTADRIAVETSPRAKGPRTKAELVRAEASSSPTPRAIATPKRTSALRGESGTVSLPWRSAEAAVGSWPAERAVFDRVAGVAAPPDSDRSGASDSQGSVLRLTTTAAAALLLLWALLASRREAGGKDGLEDARMMSCHDRASSPEDPRSGRLAVCERPTTHRPCSGIWRAGGHLRALPPVARERRPHGQRDRRARDASHGRRGSSRRLAA